MLPNILQGAASLTLLYLLFYRYSEHSGLNDHLPCLLHSTRKIPLQAKTPPLTIHLPNGSILKSGPITQETFPLLTLSAAFQQEYFVFEHCSISFLFPVILSISWLQAFKPPMDSSSKRVTLPFVYCQQQCFQWISIDSAPVSWLHSKALQYIIIFWTYLTKRKRTTKTSLALWLPDWTFGAEIPFWLDISSVCLQELLILVG